MRSPNLSPTLGSDPESLDLGGLRVGVDGGWEIQFNVKTSRIERPAAVR